MYDRVVAFPDTNVFLHFKPFKEIPWAKELGCASVCLRIPKIVIGELNKHKDTNSREHIRERAQKALSNIRKLVFSEAGHVSDRVSLVCESAATSLDMAARALDPSSSDDCILAAVLEYQEAHPDERVVLVTDDPGFALRAHSYGVHPAELSAKLKIPAQDDPKHKKIRELTQRVREIERRLPRLTLTFSDGSDRIERALEPEVMPTIDVARAYVAENLAPRFWRSDPEQLRRITAETEKLSSSAGNILQAARVIAEMIASKRNADLDTYLEQFAQYLLAFWRHGAEVRRTAQLLLRIHNSGSTPAEDVHLVLRFPKTLTIFPHGRLPPPPEQPTPPGQAPPKQVQKLAAPLAMPTGGIRYLQAIDTGTHFELRYHIEKLNHHLDEQLSGLHIRFPSFESATSFTIEYRIAAVNAPDPVTGSLHVVIQKPQPPKPRRIARPRRRAE